MSPLIYVIGEKKPEKNIQGSEFFFFFFRLLFPNYINWWAHGEDRAITHQSVSQSVSQSISPFQILTKNYSAPCLHVIDFK